MLFPTSLDAAASVLLCYCEKFENEGFCLFRAFISEFGI